MDPLTAVIDELFGEAVDPREVRDLISKANDASEMHVPGGLTLKQKKRQKREAQVGLASNILGLSAGGVALAAAAKDERFAEGGKVARSVYRLGRKLPSITPKAGKAGAITAGGAAALQAANVGGDVVANRVLGREARKKDKITKSFLVEVAKAHMTGKISRSQAEVLTDLIIAKANDSNKILSAVDQIIPALPNQKVKLARKSVSGGKAIKNKMQPAKPMTNAAPSDPTPTTASAPQITWSGEIKKSNEEKRQLFGYCTVTSIDGKPVVDRQDDYIPLDEIEKAAYSYVLESRKGGDQHTRIGSQPLHTSDMIESFVVTPEKLAAMGLPEDAVPHGWWVGFKVNDDETWEKFKREERTGFSIHGKGKRRELR